MSEKTREEEIETLILAFEDALLEKGYAEHYNFMESDSISLPRLTQAQGDYYRAKQKLIDFALQYGPQSNFIVKEEI